MGISQPQYPQNTSLPIYQRIPAHSQVVSRKQVKAIAKTIDGQVLSGMLHFRITASNIRDGLNQTEDTFIALTEVMDASGNKIDYTFLLNFAQIIYVAVPQSGENNLPALPNQDQHVQSRKIPAIVRTVAGDNFAGSIYIRNTLRRAKDELNLKDGQFIAVTDVKNHTNPEQADVYLVNKTHISFVAVKDLPDD